ncbi:phage holin family protein [Enterococcus rotai]|uniref:phage holin family protein n=1 Tax=Enterococcus rotai TaxID=118060 RepID=UPI003F49B3BA
MNQVNREGAFLEKILIKLGIDPTTNYMYLLALICLVMILDYLSGTISAYVNKKIVVKSRTGINGILKKIASLILLLFFIPLSYVVPGQIGIGLLYVLYMGYLLMELQSIFENYQKLGIQTKDFEDFIDSLKKLVYKKSSDKQENEEKHKNK